MEEFDYEKEGVNLELANKSINEVFDSYTKKISSLGERKIRTLELYFYLKKLDTIKHMTPKGSYWSEERISKMIKMGEEIILETAKKLYPDLSSIDEIENSVSIDMKDGLYDLLDNLNNDLKNAYTSYCDHVYTVLPISGLTELIPSEHRENQYLNSISNGVFSTASYESILKYVGRAHANGMIVNGRKINYPTNPFGEITEDEIMLKEPVSIYLSDAKDFEPQYDFIVVDGKPRFVFGSEWIAKDKNIPCEEKVTRKLPISFIKDNEVFVYDRGETINISSREKGIK